MTDVALPPGVHPHDRSVGLGEGAIVGQEATALLGQRRGEPWGTKPEEALGTFQRLGQTWEGGRIALTQSQVYRVVGRTKGRSKLRLWVDLDAAGAVWIGSDESVLDPILQNMTLALVGTRAILLYPADPAGAIEIESEAPVYACWYNATASVLSYLHAFSPPGGGLDI